MKIRLNLEMLDGRDVPSVLDPMTVIPLPTVTNQGDPSVIGPTPEDPTNTPEPTEPPIPPAPTPPPPPPPQPTTQIIGLT